VVSGLEFFVFSVVDVAERKAYPLSVKQTVRSEAEKEAIKQRQKKRAKDGTRKRPASDFKDETRCGTLREI